MHKIYKIAIARQTQRSAMTTEEYLEIKAIGLPTAP
jgi:hypothetical protein